MFRDVSVGHKKRPPNSWKNLETLCIKVEAAIGFEPMNNGFADRCLSLLAMPPFMERETGLEPATITLAT